MQELFDFVKTTLEQKGALLDRENGDLNAVLPPDVAESLKLPEFVTFTADGEPTEGEVSLSYNSEILEGLLDLIEQEGITSRFLVPHVQFNKEIKGRDVERKFQFVNSKLRSVKAEECYLSYLILNFKYSIISDVRKDGLFSCIINQSTLARVFGMEEAAAQRPLLPFSSVKKKDIYRSKALGDIFKKACAEAEWNIEIEIGDFKKSLARKLSRDIFRVEEYYNGLLEELRKRRRGRKSREDEEKALKEKEKAIKLELKAKRADLEKKYATRINVRLFSAAQFIVPSGAAKVELLFKKNRPVLTIPWNPVTRSLEDLVCDGCQANTSHIYFCPKLHLLCEKCHGFCITCGRKYCRVCHGEKMPCNCGKK